MNETVVCGAKDPRDKRLTPEVYGAGIAIADIDGDRWLDIVVANGAPDLQSIISGTNPAANLVYRNRGDGTFEEVGVNSGLGDRSWSIAIATGDIDNDGDVDFYITCLGPDTLFINQGNGIYREVTEERGIRREFVWSGSCAFGDYNRDGFLDLYGCVPPVLSTLDVSTSDS